MKHLSIEEITEYVEARRVTEESLKLVSRVNNHIRGCAECEEKVTAYERVYNKMRKVALQLDDELNTFDADALVRDHHERLYKEMQNCFTADKRNLKMY